MTILLPLLGLPVGVALGVLIGTRRASAPVLPSGIGKRFCRIYGTPYVVTSATVTHGINQPPTGNVEIMAEAAYRLKNRAV